jgi:hypothetical protein
LLALGWIGPFNAVIPPVLPDPPIGRSEPEPVIAQRQSSGLEEASMLPQLAWNAFWCKTEIVYGTYDQTAHTTCFWVAVNNVSL